MDSQVKRNCRGMVWLELLIVLATSSLMLLASLGAINRLIDALYRDSRLDTEMAQREALRQLFQRAWDRGKLFADSESETEAATILDDAESRQPVGAFELRYWEEEFLPAVLEWKPDEYSEMPGGGCLRLHLGETRKEWDLREWGPLIFQLVSAEPGKMLLESRVRIFFPHAASRIFREGFTVNPRP